LAVVFALGFSDLEFESSLSHSFFRDCFLSAFLFPIFAFSLESSSESCSFFLGSGFYSGFFLSF
jgi:hypothetical protein